MELVLIKKQQCKYLFSIYIQVLTDCAVAGSAQRELLQFSTQKGLWTPEECILEPSICETSGGGGQGQGQGQGHHCDTRSIYGKMLREKDVHSNRPRARNDLTTVSIISK